MFTVFAFTLLALTSAVKLPSNFQKCNRKQPDLKKCVLEAVRNAVPQFTNPIGVLNLPNLNPFVVEKASVGGQGAVAVEQKFRDCKLSGFVEGRFDNFEFDFDNKSIHIVATFPEIVKKCTYELDGKVLLLPIKGTGPSTIVLKNLFCDVYLHYEEVKKKNKTYINVLSSQVSMEPMLVTYNFENLLVTGSGDGNLGNNINQVLNDNWKEVFDEVKSGYIEIINTILISLVNGFFSKVSIEEAFD